MKTHFLTKTQSRKTAVPAPELNVDTLRTGNIGTSPRSSAARERHWTTPVEPNRYSTISFRFSTRLIQIQVVSRVIAFVWTPNIRFQFFIHLLETSSIRISHFNQVFSCIDKLAAFNILDVILLCQPSEEDFGYSGAKYNTLWILHLRNLADVLQIPSGTMYKPTTRSTYLVCIWMVDFVQSEHCREFFVDKSVHNKLHCLV